jgi:hypothetical protein
MHRRSYLAGVGAASTAGFALFAGCSGTDSGNETDGEGGAGSGDDGANGGDSTRTDDGEGETSPDGAFGDAASTDETLETGQAPPEETGTPFEETNTVPEEEGLETGQAPNATAD